MSVFDQVNSVRINACAKNVQMSNQFSKVSIERISLIMEQILLAVLTKVHNERKTIYVYNEHRKKN